MKRLKSNRLSYLAHGERAELEVEWEKNESKNKTSKRKMPVWPENRGVWVMLGNRDDGNNEEGGSEVIGVFEYKPTEKEQKEILKYYIINAFQDQKLSAEYLKREMDGYTINWVQADVQERGQDA